jgi:AcrR family transcriptional regulator
MGRKRNKEQTIRRLIDAVGRIMTEKGHSGIGVNKVAFESGVSKPMIYQCFGGLNNLLKAYIREKDYWLPFFETLELPAEFSGEELKNLYINILQ